MELLEENNRLRTELETNKQHLLLVQNGGNDAQLLTKILKEMTEMAMGKAQEPQAQVTLFSPTTKETVTDEPPKEGVKSKCAEFAMELENMPRLPGTVVVETIGIPPQATATGATAALPESIVPCLYSN